MKKQIFFTILAAFSGSTLLGADVPSRPRVVPPAKFAKLFSLTDSSHTRAPFTITSALPLLEAEGDNDMKVDEIKIIAPVCDMEMAEIYWASEQKKHHNEKQAIWDHVYELYCKDVKTMNLLDIFNLFCAINGNGINFFPFMKEDRISALAERLVMDLNPSQSAFLSEQFGSDYMHEIIGYACTLYIPV